MADHEKKHCPRCNGLFECKASNIGICECSSLQISGEAQEWIRDRYSDCICINCLTELNRPQQLFIEKFLKPKQ